MEIDIKLYTGASGIGLRFWPHSRHPAPFIIADIIADALKLTFCKDVHILANTGLDAGVYLLIQSQILLAISMCKRLHTYTFYVLAFFYVYQLAKHFLCLHPSRITFCCRYFDKLSF